MEAEWIKNIREKYNLLFEKLKGNVPKEGMYFIPKKYQHAKSLYPKEIQNNKSIREQIEYEDSVYERIQNRIPEQTGKVLESIFENPNDNLCIHRTDYSIEQIQKVIFQLGMPVRDTEYTTHMSQYKHFPTILEQIQACNEYKMAQGCLLIRLPKNNQLPIYYKNDTFLQGATQLFLLPEYIYGYVPVKNGQVGDIILNPNYVDVHNYSPDGLYYDEVLNPVESQNQIQEEYGKQKN